MFVYLYFKFSDDGFYIYIVLSCQWQSLCGFGWSSAAATVVCRMLGFPPATGAPEKSAAFGVGSVSMRLHEFSYHGTDHQLAECPMDTTSSYEGLLYFCDDNEEAGVVCGTPNGKYCFPV